MVEQLTEEQKFVTKEELKHMLTGFARVIEYGTVHVDKKGDYNPTVDPVHNYVVSMIEGQLVGGLIHGFARIHDSEGECKIGFWKTEKSLNKNAVSRPHGKFAHYFKDGSFKTPDGIYKGTDKVWNKLVRAKNNHDFVKNEL